MSNIFSNVVKYAGKWDVVGESKLDAQDLAELEPMATVVKSTWGKSFVFVTKITHYQMFIPADSEVDLPIGSKVPITDIVVVELHKDGEKNIQRCRVEEKPL
jgi:hypothetical protein